MTISQKLRALFIFIAFAVYSCNNTFAGEQPIFKIVAASTTKLVVEFSPNLIGFDTIITDNGTTTLRPTIAECSILDGLPGSPVSIVYNTLAAIPSRDGFSLDKVEALGVKRLPALIAPSPRAARNGEITENLYSINDASYSLPTSPQWAIVKYGGIARSVMTADIIITAARYDALSKTIEIPQKIRISISFPNGASVKKPAISANEIPAAVINQREALQWNTYAAAPYAKLSPDRIAGGESYAKVTVETEGVYRLTADDLIKAGIGATKNDASTIKLFGTGGKPMSENVPDNYMAEVVEQPLIVRANPDGSIQEILFYASGASGFERAGANFRHFLNYYSKTNSYILTTGGAPGLRAAPSEVPNEPSVARPTSYIARIFNEEEIFNGFDSRGFGSGTEWFGRKIDGSSTFITPLPNFLREGMVYYAYSAAHRNSTDGICNVSENGVPLGKLNIPGCYGDYVDAISENRIDSIPATSISNDNRSILKFAYSNSAGSASSEAFFDWFEIHYPRECVANNGEIELFSSPSLNGVAEYAINGFGPQIIGFDATDRQNPKLLQNTSNTGGLFILKSTFTQGEPRRFYISANFKTPKIEKVEISGLTGNFANTDIIILTHKDLVESATKFKQYRESTGLTASIVTTEQIYNEFSAGMPDIAALRNYVGFALQNWDKKPRFLVIWGDGHYDFKNIQGPQPNYIPTHQQITVTNNNSLQNFNGTLTIASDDFYACAAGNDKKADIAVGRLPVSSPETGTAILEKIKLYESNPTPGEWQQTITLIADDGPTSKVDDGTEHTNNSEALSTQIIPDDMIQRKIYMAEYAVENLPGGRRKPDVTRDYLNMANNHGTLMMNYVGHGSPRVWAHELIFERETTTPQFVNLKKLFFLTAPTCDFGRFDDPNRNCGAEDLLLSKIGGAIGVFAATRPVYSTPNLNITKAIYAQLFTRKSGKYNRLGEAIYEVKQTFFDDNDQKFVLLADPTMRLLLPEYTVSIDSINDLPTVADTANLPLMKALSRVAAQGSIRGADNSIDASFNGRALITVTDCDVADHITDAADGIVHTIIRPSGILNRSSFAVANGRFTANFVIPKDISFSNKQGHLFAFAADSCRTAKGDSRSFRVGGIESGGFNDFIGPDIAIYLDARTFKAGDIVRNSPLLIVDLSDETGINTTGMGIGHKIEAWLDDNASSIDITEAFQSSLEDSRKGSAEKQIFNLSPGEHYVRARAWDVLNNYSETQTYFRASDDKQTILSAAIAYPNPANNSVHLTFTHNLSQPFNAQFSIFAPDGRLARTLQSTITDLHTGSIAWDCKTDDGSAVAQGAYTFIVVITDANGNQKAISGMVQISK